MAITLKPATLNDYNLSLKTLHDNLNHVISKKGKTIKPSIKNLIDIYEQSTQASTTEGDK